MTGKDKDRLRLQNRYIAPVDWKQLDNDIREEPRIPPSVGIFDLPYRCYVVNEEWDAHISGAISALTEFRAWIDDDDERAFAVQEVLKLLASDGNCTMQLRQNDTNPCLLEYSIDGTNWIEFANIDDCLVVNPTIAGMQSGIDLNSLNIDTLQDVVDVSSVNDYPAPPTQETAPDELCNVAYYITDKIISFIDETLQDAQTITLEEFLTGLLTLGGFNTQLLKDFWDFIVSNSYPNLLADIQAERDTLAEYWYCNNLDRDAVRDQIDGSVIGVEAKAGIIGALDAIEDGTIALWIAVGRYVDSGEDCSAFCPQYWSQEFDFTVSDGGWVNTAPSWVGGGTPRGLYVAGVGFQSEVETTTRKSSVCSIWRELPSARVVTGIEIEYDLLQNGSWNAGYIRSAMRYTTDMSNRFDVTLLDLQSGGVSTYNWSGSINMKGINTNLWNAYTYTGGSVYSTLTIKKITLSGDGTNPF